MKRLKYLHYENNEGEKGITTFFYNKNGVNERAKWELLDKSRNSENYHSFDSSGNMVRKYREFSDNMTSDLIYIYDDNNNLIKEKFSRSDGVLGDTHYTYNDNLCIEVDCKYLYGWFHGIIKYNYDKNGKLLSSVLLKDNNKIGKITYTHDEDGNLVTEYWEFSNGFTQTFTNEYEDV